MNALKSTFLRSFAYLLVLLAAGQLVAAQAQTKPRVLISTDIGGTDPDDFQSMIHLLMYADLFQIEGLISSPFGKGRREDILRIIDLYEKDLVSLRKHSPGFPAPDALRKLCKQGSKPEAPYKGYSAPTEGSSWIISCARKPDTRPLWVLVWGGLEDLAQALHDAPDIREKIRVYWIGGPNKKWSVNAYAYLAEHHPDLWMIEANATYRGWFMDAGAPETLSGKGFFERYIRDRGAMGKDFVNYYKGEIKMGDTPSLAYLMRGHPDDPGGKSWGGSFVRINRSSRKIFERNTTTADTLPAYGIIEWRFPGPVRTIHPDSACFTLQVGGQDWPGYYLGKGTYAVRYSPKQPETGMYRIVSTIPALDGLAGAYVSVVPWPGPPSPHDYPLGANWYSDRPEPELFLGVQQGARTISRYREEFLMDWARRWAWLE